MTKKAKLTRTLLRRMIRDHGRAHGSKYKKGSISAFAREYKLHPTTLSKYLSHERANLSATLTASLEILADVRYPSRGEA